MAGNDRTFTTTETSFAVVHAIEEASGATFAELRSRLDLPKSTLYYHLNTLTKLGYVVKEDGTYQLGLRFLSLAEQAKRKEPAFDVVRSKARDLADRMPEEIDFSTEENGRLVVVYHNIGGSAMTDFEIGQYLYLHATANGKVLLAEKPEERVDEIIDRWGLPALTANTITDRTVLKEELDRIRERGYAINDEEQREGLRSVGAKITKPDGSVLGSLAVDGATYRLTDEQIEEHTVRELFDTIDQIETELEQG
ncbi:transcriptional regulator, IclR family [Halarchaeum acidiphilum MH1-52-1]|uniref:Transcriptional regulator, IclR family n=1 Tax=Halarchaeum acidiphilum MH1-52-1 TaxID=1261545 RepID=U2YVG9_9EURY|nr:IclR family transcriptional regulator [Halarchaeum acidiphilum]GAD53020.1 transcriptional regulator, IclR family [Halarchaeum acidiphilum MH1-52-1]